jgi:hypothetical protein
VLGGVVAGRAIQARTATLVAVLATANGALFAFADVLPATVPTVLALILIDCTPPAWVLPRAPLVPVPAEA